MSRLIDADALKKEVLGLSNCYNGFSDTYDKACIIGLIDEQPTISPKTGRWIEQPHNDWKYSKEFRCSECGKYRLVTNPAGWEWHYCPNCGARMKGEEDE